MKGHVRERGKGNWYAVLSVNDPQTGKRKVKFHSLPGCKGKRQAETECARIVQEMTGGTYVDASRVTIADFLDKWDADYAAQNVTPKTRERYVQLMKNQTKPNIGAIQLQKLRPAHLSELYAKLLKSGLSARTVNHVHRLLHRTLWQAAAWEIVKQNVATSVEPPKAGQAAVVILSSDQVAAVMKGVTGRTLRPIVALALATGARRGELLALRIGDFDQAANTIRIERSLEQTKAGLRFKPPKTKHGRRTVSLPPFAAAELRAHMVRMQELRLSLGMGRAGDDDLLFPRWDTGKVRAPHWLTQKFAQLMEYLNIKGVTFHSLRHTHASQLIASGMDVLTISRRLGHGSPAITLSVYGHMFTNTDARAAEITEGMVTGFGTD
jgi:integrase